MPFRRAGDEAGREFAQAGRLPAEQDVAARHALALGLVGAARLDWELARGAMLWSDAACVLHGLPRGTEATSRTAFLACVATADRGRVRRAMDESRARAAPLSVEFAVEAPGQGCLALLWRGALVRDGAGRPERYVGVVVDLTEQRDAERRQCLMRADLQQRLRGTLALVRAIAARTLEGAPMLAGLRAAFEGRIDAVARTQSALLRDGVDATGLRELVEEELRACGAGERVTIAGPPVRLHHRAAQGMALVFHELAANALRHGGLAFAAASVEIAWSVTPRAAPWGTAGPDSPAGALRASGDPAAGAPPALLLAWSESGVPVMNLEPRRGQGRERLETGVARELGARTRLLMRPGGIRYEIELQLAAGIGFAVEER